MVDDLVIFLTNKCAAVMIILLARVDVRLKLLLDYLEEEEKPSFFWEIKF